MQQALKDTFKNTSISAFNEPAFYCVPAKAYEALLNRLEDLELNAIADARQGQAETEVSLDDL